MSDRQLYLTSLLTNTLGLGPAAVVTAMVPDLHCFCNRGAKDVIPLYRDVHANDPNVTHGLLQTLSKALRMNVSAEDVFTYVYGVLASPAYVERFSEELCIPGPRVPLTCDHRLFESTVQLGRRLAWLHTFGTRLVPAGERRSTLPRGLARCVKAVPELPEAYPAGYSYEPSSRVLHVGDGRFAPVPSSVWEFRISGFDVVRSWLGYRMKTPSGRSSSPLLDEIRPQRWTKDMTQEFLQLLWILEATVQMFPDLERNLGEIIAGAAIPARSLPLPSAEEREPPEPDGPTDLQGVLDMS